ncbi:hypothetical protein HK102_013479 [Quaeritorhiza haematococci]|nr:hypothetical protein HK102_013479 [Quaeritorhiza haematococci]
MSVLVRRCCASLARHPCRRSISTSPAIVYEKFGSPDQVLNAYDNIFPTAQQLRLTRARSIPLPRPTPSDVKIKFITFPINPADINQIQGTYPVQPRLEDDNGYVPGNEGLAEVVEVGDAVKDLAVGDWVIPATPGFGTWRKYASCKPNEVIKLDKRGISPVAAATITVNPCTAYRMLRDFVPLKPGDVVIQNGANSGVGQAVIQLCKAWGLKSVNVVRDRPNLGELVTSLRDLGATEVVTDTELRKSSVESMLKELGSPKLALNCVGGKSATNLARLLGHSGCMVTYGGMSKEPVTIPTSLLIFRNLTFNGFWMTRWYNEHSIEEKGQMLDDLLNMMRKGEFAEPAHVKVDWSPIDHGDQDQMGLAQIISALRDAMAGFAKGKQIIMVK